MKPDDFYAENEENMLPANDSEGKGLSEKRTTARIAKQTYALTWNNRPEDTGDLLPFIAHAICKAYPGTKTPIQFVKLLDTQPGTAIIIVPFCYLAPVMMLAQLFYLCGRITCHGNHGIFTFIAQHTKDPAKNEAYTSGQIRITVKRCKLNESRKEHLKESVRPLFLSVCQRKSDQIVFENYFL
jgi:hypothetical protein